MSKKPLTYFSIIVLAVGLVFLANGIILAWTAPTQNPPNGNVASPINVGTTEQSKQGRLGVSTSDADNSYGLTVGTNNTYGIKADRLSWFGGGMTVGGTLTASDVNISRDVRITGGLNANGGIATAGIQSTGDITIAYGNSLKAPYVRGSTYPDLDDSSYYLNPNTSSRLRRVLATDWIETETDLIVGDDLYLGEGNHHFSTDGNVFIRLTSNDIFGTGMTFYESDNTYSGRIYGRNAGNSLGFQDSDNNWTFRAYKDVYTSLYVNGHEYLKVWSDGDVSINRATPPISYKLYVNGTAYSTGGWTGSDVRWKNNIVSLENSLEKVEQLRGVSYDWNIEDYPDNGFMEGKQVGLIAQEVEEVIPEVVNTDEEGYKSVSYEKLVPVLIEAVKELKAENEALSERILILENEN